MTPSSLRIISEPGGGGEAFAFGRFRIDPEARELRRGDEPVVLPAKAFDTLLHLVRNRGRLVPKDELLRVVWPDVHVDENSLSKAVSVLRKALADGPATRLIVTVPGRGYQFVARVERADPAVPIPRDTPARAPRSGVGVEAIRLYERGRFLLAKRTAFGSERSVAYFERALEADPGFAPALVALAEAHVVRAYYHFIPEPPRALYERAADAVRRALDLDAGLGGAWALLGWLHTEFDWDWAGAGEALRRALELEPENGMARFWFARYQFMVGDPEASLVSMRQAIEADPLSVALQSGLGGIYHFLRRYDDAVVQLEHALELEPENVRVLLGVGRALEMLGELADAAEPFDRALALAPEYPAAVAAIGHLAAKRGELALARALAGSVGDGPQAAAAAAVVHAAIGDFDLALRLLERALEDRALNVVELVFDPRLDPLRGEAGYRALLARVGLTDYAYQGREPARGTALRPS